MKQVLSGRRFLLLDVGLTNLGWAVFCLPQETFRQVGCITTESRVRKDNTYVVNDNIRRCELIVEELESVIVRHRPECVVAEFPHGGARRAKALSAMAMSTGLIAAFCGVKQLPLFPVKPSDTKRLVSGTLKASKDQVIRYVVHAYGNILTESKVRLTDDRKAEHIADAMVLASVMRRKLESLLCL